jgi:hypothetical protein
MHLVLDDDEAAVLLDFIERHLGDMSMEISHTDSPTYRHTLRERRDTLRRIASRLTDLEGDDRAAS